MSLLEELFTIYGTDKGIWGYTEAYEKHLDRNVVRNVLEIGICGFRDIPNNVVGASLFAWRDYFPNATVYGIDNDSRFIFNDQARIKTALADAYDPVQMAALMAEWHPSFDFICDDAVHDPLPQLALLQTLWPFVSAGGVYAIEEFCPYKVMSERQFVSLVLGLAPEANITVYETHKPERLMILRKP